MLPMIGLIILTPTLQNQKWSSFIAYVLIVSVLGIAGNYISSYQLRLFKESSIRDHLTGLFNRRYFDVTLENKFQRSISKGFRYGIILIDIDNFKKYNDIYGHSV
ncbi:MAG: diguanylate cyclase, partial [Spirochaetia bacterium]|nr:diguanylate cyclase [Spirochaetia bacterium]